MKKIRTAENTAVLISIKPKWLRLILNGEKTIEIRKRIPKLSPPFKMYLYCSEKNAAGTDHQLDIQYPDGRVLPANGYVVAECWCTYVDWFQNANQVPSKVLEQACLPKAELLVYAGAKPCTAWPLSHVEILNQPLALSDFGLERAPQSYIFVDKRNF